MFRYTFYGFYTYADGDDDDDGGNDDDDDHDGEDGSAMIECEKYVYGLSLVCWFYYGS